MAEPWSSIHTKPFILRSRLHPTDATKAECRFYDDEFLPDYHYPLRLSRVNLLKGSAIQINRPMNCLREIQIGNGIFLTKGDFVEFMRMYHTNLIGEDDPYPTEYIVMREEDYSLELPSGLIYSVTFAEAAQAKPVKLTQGRWVYTLTCKFRILPTDDEQEEL